MACSQPSDCAPSQVCGNDGYCATENVAGTCAKIAATDAGTDGRPTSTPDAKPPVDSWPTVKLYVRIDGRGIVTLPTIGECDGGSGQMLCEFDVAKDVPVTLQASPKNNWRFERWEDACSGALTETCAIVPSSDSQARARFETVDD